MTVLQIINNVLRRLREDTVSSLVETDYVQMLVDILHDVHQDLLEDHDWSSMDYTIDVPVDASQRVLDLTRTESGSGDVADTSTPTTNDSSLRFDRRGRACVWIFDSNTDTNGEQMVQISEEEMERLYQSDRDQTNEKPIYFSLRLSNDRTGHEMKLWPIPSVARHIRMRWWIPEDSIDTADGSRTVLVPSRPLVLGTYFMALNERGEEMGEPGGLAERRYESARDGAVEQDMRNSERTNRYEFWRD